MQTPLAFIRHFDYCISLGSFRTLKRFSNRDNYWTQKTSAVRNLKFLTYLKALKTLRVTVVLISNTDQPHVKEFLVKHLRPAIPVAATAIVKTSCKEVWHPGVPSSMQRWQWLSPRGSLFWYVRRRLSPAIPEVHKVPEDRKSEDLLTEWLEAPLETHSLCVNCDGHLKPSLTKTLDCDRCEMASWCSLSCKRVYEGGTHSWCHGRDCIPKPD